MERRRAARAAEHLKSILIVALTLSAVALVGRLQLSSGLPDWLARSGFFGGTAVTSVSDGNGQTGISAGLRPVRVAVRNEDGCYGIQYDTQALDTAFQNELGGLLGEALAGAGESAAVSEDEWRRALGGQAGVYYDFLGSVPLSALSGWLAGEENDALTGDARRILLTAGSGSKATLYYGGGDDGLYYACTTTVENETRLKTVTAGYTPNNAVFAFEQEDRYPNLEPYVMILPEPPEPAVFQVSNPFDTEDSGTLEVLLSVFSFHPQTSSVYEVAGGKVVREGTDTLRISTSGTVTFHAADGEDPRYKVTADEHVPSRGEMVEAASALIEDGMSAWSSDAGLYLMGTDALQDGTYAVYFGYLLDGAAVELQEDGWAARIVITGTYISDFTLHFRTYQKTDTLSAVLPEMQAVAAMNALQAEGNELLLCYPDLGGTQTEACWAAK